MFSILSQGCQHYCVRIRQSREQGAKTNVCTTGFNLPLKEIKTWPYIHWCYVFHHMCTPYDFKCAVYSVSLGKIFLPKFYSRSFKKKVLCHWIFCQCCLLTSWYTCLNCFLTFSICYLLTFITVTLLFICLRPFCPRLFSQFCFAS